MSLPASPLERHSPVPLYVQLKSQLLARLESGQWRPGEQMPGDQEVMDEYGVSRATVRQAFRDLENAGLVARFRGRGTFAARPKFTHGPDARHRLGDSMRAQGLTPGWRLLECATRPAPPDVAQRLGVPAGRPICCLRRLRLAEGEPIGLHDAWSPVVDAARLERAPLETGESMAYLGEIVARSDLRIERVIEAVAASEAEAAVLGLEPGTPVLHIGRRLLAGGGDVIEDLSARYRGDRFQYLTQSDTR